MSEKTFIEEVDGLLKDIVKKHADIKDIDLVLKELYPVAVVKDNMFYLFDIRDEDEYRFVKTDTIPGIEVPEGVLAAFPLPFYENRGSVVVGKQALETLEGNVFVFHEFVHCYQMDTCEFRLKEELSVHREAMETGNGMWELNHPFPYEEKDVQELLNSLYQALMGSDKEEALKVLEQLKDTLQKENFEYMVWQMWKEGYARYVENKLRSYYGLKLNTGDISGVHDRVIFYELGAGFAELFVNEKQNDTGIEDFFRYLMI